MSLPNGESRDRLGSHQNPYAAPTAAAMAVPAKPVGKLQLSEYRSVRTALQLIYYSVVSIFASAVCMVLLIAVAGGAIPVIVRLFVMLFGLIIAVCMLVLFVGFCMCVTAPQKNEKNRFLIALAMHVFSFLIGIVGAVLATISAVNAPSTTGLLDNQFPLESAFDWVAQVFSTIGTVYFILFCRQIGDNIGSQKLVRASGVAMNWFIAMIAASLVAAGVLLFAGYVSPGVLPEGIIFDNAMIAAPVGILLVGLVLIAFIKQMKMIRVGIEALRN